MVCFGDQYALGCATDLHVQGMAYSNLLSCIKGDCLGKVGCMSLELTLHVILLDGARVGLVCSSCGSRSVCKRRVSLHGLPSQLHGHLWMISHECGSLVAGVDVELGVAGFIGPMLEA